MRAIRVPVVVAFHLCSLVSVVAGTPQSPVVARDAKATTPSGSATVRGRVVAAATGEPIGRATVRVESPSLKQARSMMTDLDGRFEFQHLPASQVTLSASKPGFLSLQYGQRSPFQTGRRIELTVGQVLDTIGIALPHAGAIAGRVFDDLGEPATGVVVQAARLKFEGGRRTLSSSGSRGETDDRGEYRISDLRPGSYFVLTSREGVAANATSVDEGIVLTSTYYPSASNTVDARLVTLRGSQEVRGIDITQLAAPAHSVSGTLLDSLGRPVTEGVVFAHPADYDYRASVHSAPIIGRSVADGRFAIRNLTAGRYVLRGVPSSRRDAAPGEASLPVMVADVDIDGLVLQAAPPAAVKGRVTIDADVQPPFAPSAISILARGELEPVVGSTTVKSDWTFTLDGLAATSIRVVGGSPFPDGWSIRSIRVGDVDVERTSLELSSGRAVNADVVITNRIAALRGRVTTDDKQPVPDYTVLVFSTDARRWLPGARGIVALRTDQTGEYKCSGMPAGSYYAVALEFVDDGEESNPEFLDWARARATRVELVEGETVSLDLDVLNGQSRCE